MMPPRTEARWRCPDTTLPTRVVVPSELPAISAPMGVNSLPSRCACSADTTPNTAAGINDKKAAVKVLYSLNFIMS